MSFAMLMDGLAHRDAELPSETPPTAYGENPLINHHDLTGAVRLQTPLRTATRLFVEKCDAKRPGKTLV
jgi:hypothetical protein